MVNFQLKKIVDYCEKNCVDEYENEYILDKIHKLFVANNIRNYSISVDANKDNFMIEVHFHNSHIKRSWDINKYL